MKSMSPICSLSLAALAVGFTLAAAGCQEGGNGDQNHGSRVAGHTGPGAPGDKLSSGVGPGGHEPATNGAPMVGPSGAGPAGSQ